MTSVVVAGMGLLLGLGTELEIGISCPPDMGQEWCVTVRAKDLDGVEVGGAQAFLLFTDVVVVAASPGDYDAECETDPTSPISFLVYTCWANEGEPWDCPNMSEWPPDGTGKIGILTTIPLPPNAPTADDQDVATIRFVVTGDKPRVWWDPEHDPETSNEAKLSRLGDTHGDEIPMVLTEETGCSSDPWIVPVPTLSSAKSK